MLDHLGEALNARTGLTLGGFVSSRNNADHRHMELWTRFCDEWHFIVYSLVVCLITLTTSVCARRSRERLQLTGISCADVCFVRQNATSIHSVVFTRGYLR